MSSNTTKATALLTAVALVGGGYAIGTSGEGSASAAKDAQSRQGRPLRRGGPPGPNIAALASKLGVTQAQLRTALNSVRPAGRPPGGPGRGGPGRHDATAGKALAAALGTDQAKTIAAFRKAHRAHHAAGRHGPQEGSAAMAKVIAAELGVDEAKVKAALDKLRADRKAEQDAHRDQFAAALAKALNLDVDKVKAALEATKPAGGPRGPGGPPRP